MKIELCIVYINAINTSVTLAPAGGETQVYVNIKKIIEKFTEPTKLTTEMKNQFPKHIGQIRIDGGGIYKTLNKEEFLLELSESGAIGSGDGAWFTIEQLKVLDEIHVINEVDDFIIYKSDW